MIRASKIIPIVDDNRQFQGISVTVYDNKIRKRIRLETYKGEVRYNLQDIAVLREKNRLYRLKKKQEKEA